MKKLTKILSILLAVALAVTGFVLAVSADDAEPGKASYTVNGESPVVGCESYFPEDGDVICFEYITSWE